DNYRKRTQRERADLLKTAASGLITQLLPVLDDFDRAARSFDSATDVVAIREGVELIHGKLKKVLEQKGLEEIRSVGEPFDTDLHEAITNLPAESEEMRGKVVDEIEKGYMLNGAVIRYAKVAVAN
ncbi:MAG: nucleotide exchange factor GrpE, partial [Bacteroidales bacterium]